MPALMGPTGSGKTGLVCALDGERFEVVSCDSRQLYVGLEIGSAAPTEQEQARMPHHLVGLLGPDQTASVGFFRKRALAAIEDIFSRGRQPLLVGGTGFYYAALRSRLFDVRVPDRIRVEIEALTHEERIGRLRTLDPAAFVEPGEQPRSGRIHENDRYRVQRALEICVTTGRPWSGFWSPGERSATDHSFQLTGFWLNPPEEAYRAGLRTRAQSMISRGLVPEAGAVFEKYGECAALKTLGYREALAVYRGEQDETWLEDQLVVGHRQYAKRQRTWFRKEASLTPISAQAFAGALDELILKQA